MEEILWNFVEKHSEAWSVFFSFCLLICSVLQWKILAGQKKIQEQGIRVALLQERMKAFQIINDFRAELLHTNLFFCFIEGAIDKDSVKKKLSHITDLCLDFHKISLQAKFLFNAEIYQNLHEISVLVGKYQEYLGAVLMLMLLNTDKARLLPFFNGYIPDPNTGKRNDEAMRKEYVKIFGAPAAKLLLTEEELKDKINAQKFLDSFLEYLEVKDLGK